MFSCPDEGVVSLLALVPARQVVDVDDEHAVLVHLTVCRSHVRPARRWLQARSPDPVEAFATETVVRDWERVMQEMGETPVYRLTKIA